jgi:thioredoxin-related protein
MRLTSYALSLLAAIVLVAGISACNKKEGKTAATGTSINWMGYTEGMQKAKETGKPLIVDYYTTWCKYCKLMDEQTYSDPEVIALVNNNFIAIKVNAEGTAEVVDNGKKMTERDLAASNKISGYPTIWFFDEKGAPIAPLPGYSAPADFKPVLTFITSGAYAKGIKYPEYIDSLKKVK